MLLVLHGDSESLSSLQATVKLLSDQMAWFVDRLNEPEAELDNNSAVRDGAQGCVQPELAEEGEIVDALAEIGNAYADIANLGTEVDGQLATIVNNILTSRMTDEKVKEKMEKFIRPVNCNKLEVSRVNVEIWDRLSVQARARDQRAQRVQKSVIQAMVAVTSAVSDLVRDAKTGETASAKMADTITKLVDALALMNHAMQDSNQHRRDDLKGEINQAYKGLSKGAPGPSTLLYGDDLTSRIKDMNESNRVASKIGTAGPSQGSFNAQRAFTRGRGFGRHQPYAARNWMGRFRGAFLGPAQRSPFRGRASSYNNNNRRGGGLHQSRPRTAGHTSGRDQPN